MKNLTIILCLLMSSSWQLIAQEKTITGTVTSVSDGLPLPGVNVIIKGSTNGAQTNFDGQYNIKAQAGDILVFSYIGQKSKSVIVAETSIINVVLEDDITLDEVVVVAYGTQKKVSILGAITSAKVSKAQLKKREKQRFHNQISNQLAGKVKGITTIKRRNTLGTTNILYIVDGIPIQKNYNGLIDKLEPNKIEHINIYKSTKAIDMFGESAKYGCIVITTKKGNYRIQNDEDYANITENNFETTELDPLSTFSIDVDKAGYSNVRRLINNAEKIPTDAVKIEEMVNYFNYNYPQPTDKHPFSINTEVVQTPWHKETQLVRIGL